MTRGRVAEGETASAFEAPADQLGGEERRTLLEIARRAIEAHLRAAPLSLPDAHGALGRERGAFVTLRRRADGELRGCVGWMRSDRSLLETVARVAVAAATADGRFEPVTLGELPGLAIDVSALGELREIRPEDVVVGRHGLMIRLGARGGVLLPQVPVEQGWDRETFLAHTCRKARLPEDAWRSPDAELLGFTATVFGEEEEGR